MIIDQLNLSGELKGLRDPSVFNNQMIGVEIEVENAPSSIPRKLEYWEIARDGSLRNNGVEFRFKRPLSGRYIQEALREFEFLCKKSSLNFSDRTSVHIHLDFRYMDVLTLKYFIGTYLVLEPLILNTLNPKRVDNNYCLPLLPNLRHCVNVIRFMVNGNLAELFRNSNRYWALNMTAMQKFGSVEFRALEGTYQRSNILRYVNLLQWLQNNAKNIDTPVTEYVINFQPELIPRRFRWLIDENVESTIEEAKAVVLSQLIQEEV